MSHTGVATLGDFYPTQYVVDRLRQGLRDRHPPQLDDALRAGVRWAVHEAKVEHLRMFRDEPTLSFVQMMEECGVDLKEYLDPTTVAAFVTDEILRANIAERFARGVLQVVGDLRVHHPDALRDSQKTVTTPSSTSNGLNGARAGKVQERKDRHPNQNGVPWRGYPYKTSDRAGRVFDLQCVACELVEKEDGIRATSVEKVGHQLVQRLADVLVGRGYARTLRVGKRQLECWVAVDAARPALEEIAGSAVAAERVLFPQS